MYVQLGVQRSRMLLSKLNSIMLNANTVFHAADSETFEKMLKQ